MRQNLFILFYCINTFVATDFSLQLSGEAESLEQILLDCRDTLKYSVKTGTAQLSTVTSRKIEDVFF